nr:MAG: capsid protein [Wufeng shrew picorna-like virus 5]WPV63508.1 MAG: capsid protein [Wufeng shrew picorna-like virus 5]
MSQLNAPIPEGSGPKEVFDSAIQSGDAKVSSTAGSSGPATGEMTQHSGASNGIDPYLHKQYICTETFVWETGMNPGTLLFSKPIHPARSNQYIAHLAKMYNVYGGGIDFSIKVCGTGFHAGALMIVRLPPNIDPNTLTSVQDISAFEYCVIDPKTLEVESKSVMDQRNVMYHYLPLNVNDHQSFGGFFAIYVLVPLNTSASGSNQIAIQVFERPSPDFAYAQLKPLQVGQIQQAIPSDLINSLNSKSQLSCLPNSLIKHFVIHPNTLSNVEITPFTHSLGGVRYGRNENTILRYTQPLQKVGDNVVFPFSKIVHPTLERPHVGDIIQLTTMQNKDKGTPIIWTSDQASWVKDEVVVKTTGTITDLSNSTFFTVVNTCRAPVLGEKIVFTPPFKESIISVQSENQVLIGCKDTQMLSQHPELSRLLEDVHFDDFLSPSEDFLLEAIDKATKLPLFPVRLTFRGPMTTYGRSGDTFFKYSDIVFNYVGTIANNVPLAKSTLIPAQHVYARNLAIVHGPSHSASPRVRS